MAGKNKTQPTTNDVISFITALDDEKKKKDSSRLIRLIGKETGYEPQMWGDSIVGFGSYHYNYDSGHEGDAPLVGFSPRKNALTLYLSQIFENKEQLLEKLEKYKAGKGCLYIKKLEDIDEGILRQMIAASGKFLRERYPT